MNDINNCQIYQNEIKNFRNSLDLNFLNGKTILLSGSRGLVMSYLIDTILNKVSQNTNVIAVLHSNNSNKRFKDDKRLSYIYGDVTDADIFSRITNHIDYVISAASLTDPLNYKNRPIDTMLINIYGTKNMLDVAYKNNAKFVLISSCEIYGESDNKPIEENYCGPLDILSCRNCYNESKRASETLCISYATEKNVNVSIARLSRCFGPTQSIKDTKALSQFLMNGLRNEDIVLKSKGDQQYSYTYVQDAVSGILNILNKGETCNAYNIANDEIHSLKEIADMIANIANVNVKIDLSNTDSLNKNGYSKIKNSILDISKIKQLGWSPKCSIFDSLKQTYLILKDLYF